MATALNVAGLAVAFAAFIVILIQINFERTFDRRHINANRLACGKPARPRGIEGQLVDVVFLGVAAMGDAPKDARGDARMQIGGVTRWPLGRKMHASGDCLRIHDADRGEVFHKQRFESTRTTGKELFH